MRRPHALYNGTHNANRKILKITRLLDGLITKGREITKARNVLGTNGWIRQGYAVLKRRVLILSDLIFESRVVPGIPSLATGADGPNTSTGPRAEGRSDTKAHEPDLAELTRILRGLSLGMRPRLCNRLSAGPTAKRNNLRHFHRSPNEAIRRGSCTGFSRTRRKHRCHNDSILTNYLS
jgi:hypothetical protein